MTDLTFPRHVHRRGGEYAIVDALEPYEQAIHDGWLDHPDPSWPVPNWPDVYREVALDAPITDHESAPPIGDPASPLAPERKRKKPGPKPKAGPKPSESE